MWISASSEHNKYCYNCIEGADTATLEKVKDDIKPCDENITLSNTKLYEDTVANHRPACYTVHANSKFGVLYINIIEGCWFPEIEFYTTKI